MRQRIVIVGAGPAGVAAAVQCRRLGVEPFVLEQSGSAGGLVANAFRVENLPVVAPCAGLALAARLCEHLARFDIEIHPAVATHVSRTSGGLLVVTDGGELAADAVILAPGTSPVRPELPGLDGSCRRLFFEVCDLLHRIPLPSSALVLGGGEAALDYALSLADAGAGVTVLVRGEAPTACRSLVDAVTQVPTITIHVRVRVAAYAEDNSSVLLTVERDDAVFRLSADCLLVAVGRVSRAPDLLDPQPGQARTNASIPYPNLPLFVAGDARHGGLGQVAMALGDGLSAARLAVEAVS